MKPARAWGTESHRLLEVAMDLIESLRTCGL